MAYKSINPYTGELIKEYGTISDNDLKLKLEQSNMTFRLWRKSEIKERSSLLLRFADLLEDELDKHATLISCEMGKPLKQARAEVLKSAAACRYYASEAKEMLLPKYIKTASGSSKVLFEPQGTVFAIMPWNFPYWQVIRCLAPAVMSGNCVMLKHASNVPGSALLLEETFKLAGAPEGLFYNLFVSHKQTADIIENQYIRSISLTGSNIAGEIIAAKAGSQTKKCVLELGGSDPFIVFNDADPRKASKAAIAGRFQNNGQSCIASKRLFVEDGIYDSFMQYFLEGVKALKCGDPMDPDTDIGPLVNRDAVLELQQQVKNTLEMGAEIVQGKLKSRLGEAFFEPMVVVNVPYNSALSVEETFGPVIPVFRFNNYVDMIGEVNASVFGLGSSAWTNSEEIIAKLEKDIDSGTLTINGFTKSDHLLPFGGVKSSGYGRELSDLGMKEFLNIKTISRFS